MRQVTKIFLLMAAVGLGVSQSARAYSLAGPVGNGGDAWQVQNIGWGPPSDIVAAKNLGEEYRRNTPVMYYTFDQNFNDFYGSAGITAVDKAFTILNVTFTNSPSGPIRGLDGYSVSLSEFPLDSRHQNYTALGLGILDMSSYALGQLVGQLGLADSVFYTWGIHDRYLPPGGTCPEDEEYLVIQRNFDYISSPLNVLQYSPYVNDTLYTYHILEACSGPPVLAFPDILSVDPLADYASPVSSFQHGNIFWGSYYTGLTRDDVAGLRYLLSTNNVNYETISPDSLLYTIATNTSSPTVFPPYIGGGTNFVSGTNSGYYIFSGTTNNGYGYGDLTAFLAFIKTNPPAVVQATYPGVAITSVSNSATIVSNATIVSYYTNAPVGSPYGSPPQLVVTTNYQRVFEILYYYTFANIFTNHYTTGYQLLVTQTAAFPIGSPYGSGVVTNTTVRKIPHTSADFFVLPIFYTNVCPIDILPYGSIPTVLATTNFESLALTNSTTTNFSSSTYLVNFFTNYSYLIDPVTCTAAAGAQGYFQGIEKIQFVYVPFTNFDTLTGLFYEPVTNNYTLILVTNGLLQVQNLQRVVTTPDFLFSAADLTAGGGGIPLNLLYSESTVGGDNGFVVANVLPALAGPGTILAPNTNTWNKDSAVFFNTPLLSMTGTPYFTETPGIDPDDYYDEYFVMGSFDGTTNAPIVFPNGTSIDNLENQVLIQVSPLGMANGALNQPYSAVHFSATGGALVAPLTWSGAELPPGLSISPSGVLSGTPTATGTYYFTVALTDSNGLSVQYNYTMMIQ